MADACRYRSCNVVREIDCPHVFLDKRPTTRGPFGHTSTCSSIGRNLFERRRNRAGYKGLCCFGVEAPILSINACFRHNGRYRADISGCPLSAPGGQPCAISPSPFRRKVLVLAIAQGLVSAGSNATTRVHHATRRRDGVAARGAWTAVNETRRSTNAMLRCFVRRSIGDGFLFSRRRGDELDP